MLVDRSAADITASRKRYLGTLVLAEKRTDKIIGSTDAADVFVIYRYLMDGRSVDLYGMTIDTVNLRSNLLDCLRSTLISRTSGRFSMTTSSSVIMEAARIPSAAFFAR